jgi:hypothetical protein
VRSGEPAKTAVTGESGVTGKSAMTAGPGVTTAALGLELQ